MEQQSPCGRKRKEELPLTMHAWCFRHDTKRFTTGVHKWKATALNISVYGNLQRKFLPKKCSSLKCKISITMHVRLERFQTALWIDESVTDHRCATTFLLKFVASFNPTVPMLCIDANAFQLAKTETQQLVDTREYICSNRSLMLQLQIWLTYN